MTDMLIRDVPDDEATALKVLAAREGISVVELLRRMIAETVAPRPRRSLGMLTGVCSTVSTEALLAPMSEDELADWYGE
jgi:plasmid stability protein